MTIAGPIVTNACATVPSGPCRRTTSTAPNVVLQKSISAEASRQTNIGITTGTPAGIGSTLLIIGYPHSSFLVHCYSRALPDATPDERTPLVLAEVHPQLDAVAPRERRQPLPV